MLPGPPREMKGIWSTYVAPWLAERQDSVFVSRYCRVINIGESALENRLRTLLETSKNPTIAPYAGSGEVMLRVTARAATREEAFALTEPVVELIREECGDDLYTVDKDSMQQVVVELLREMGLTVATCESLTGGQVAAKLTDIPGSSEVFECGLVTYSNRVKQLLADVPEETLAQHTAVSLETAAAMAEGALARSGASVALSTTGVAGPEDTELGEAGTVFSAVAGPLGTRAVQLPMIRSKDRNYNRAMAATKALDHLRRYLLELRQTEEGSR